MTEDIFKKLTRLVIFYFEIAKVHYSPYFSWTRGMTNFYCEKSHRALFSGLSKVDMVKFVYGKVLPEFKFTSKNDSKIIFSFCKTIDVTNGVKKLT